MCWHYCWDFKYGANMIKQSEFDTWLEGIFEDDPLDFELKYFDFVLENEYPRVNLSFSCSEDGLFNLYRPMEAQSFFNEDFFNLKLNNKNMFLLVKKVLLKSFTNFNVRQYINRQMVIRLGFKGKKMHFLKQLD